ncbi:MAG: FadR family transcriptional regulator [Acidobacteriota bacterium]|nr:FCD domain-containing protein [Acidobacteriota bacterium]MDE3031089.1 FadR family transcriptional regulator [Acidobacteriota bacterium]MDE3094142.1 FadR family transcriptional regulator [Acidobacteriota bacterium]MDE3140025.1 FadR family transcriptional regulator [Acidobacteriota bacterium]MDE3147571.1 FadR family transcriptional regulator [Acidobacteriota bacterium]
MESLFHPIRESGSLSDRIVTLIEELIDSQALGEGQRLPPERDLAAMLGVSRPALREAIKILEAHQRLVVRHGQGVFVGLNKQDLVRQRVANLEVSLMELFRVREVLESAAANWAAASATPEEIEALSRILQEQEEAYAEPVDYVRLKQLDGQFHTAIVTMAKNRFLSQTFGALQEMIDEGMETTLQVPGRLEISRNDHHRVFAAIKEGNADMAAASAAIHIDGAKNAAMKRLRQTS